MQELQRLTAYYSLYAMRENMDGTKPKDLYSFPWEREKNTMPPISADEIAELQAEMDAINAEIENAEVK